MHRVHCVMVIIIFSSLHLAPPLTLSNVLAHVQDVKNWRELGEWLLPLNSEQLNTIRRENTSDQDQLCAALELWFKGMGYFLPSWRCLIWSLGCAGELSVADTIRRFAEPPPGESS